MRPPLLFLLLLAVVCGVSALSLGEEAALGALFKSFPALALANPPWHSNVSYACDSPTFYGLTCSDADDYHILRIEFNIESLSGSMPEAIGGLEWLESLSMKNACISAALPDSVGQLRKLTSLELTEAFCRSAPLLASTIPETIGDLENLKTLSIALGTLNGSLPESIGNLTSLEHLIISTAELNPTTSTFGGYLPATMDKLIRLKTLSLEQTQLLSFEQPIGASWPDLEVLSFAQSSFFTGPVNMILAGSPNLTRIDFGNTKIVAPRSLLVDILPNLTHLRLDNSLVNANITLFWSHHPQLRFMSAANCRLFGTITPDVALTQLTYLDLSYTSVSGMIPAEIANCLLETLLLSNTRLVACLPDEFSLLMPTLRHLDLSHLKPDVSSPTLRALDYFDELEHLLVSSSGFTGSIPHGLGKKLLQLRLDNNALTGTIPEFRGNKHLIFDVHGNQLNGSIPQSVAARSVIMNLAYNNFNGTMAAGLFYKSPLIQLSAAHNQFSGQLPQFGAPVAAVDLSFNQFEGNISSSYCNCGLADLSNNALSGSLEELTSDPQHCAQLTTLIVSQNRLSGTISSLENLERLQKLVLSQNLFSGTLPLLPRRMAYFDASHNRFNGNGLSSWQATAGVQNLTHLDLGFNYFSVSSSYSLLIGPNLKYLSVAENTFGKMDLNLFPFMSLTTLDATSTGGSGSFPLHLFPNVVSLTLAKNFFTGDLALGLVPALTQLDVSYNGFNFEVSRFSSLPLLTKLDASRNKLYGDLSLDYLTNLQNADLSWNDLNQAPDLVSIGNLFRYAALQRLDISRNPRLRYIFTSLDTSVTGLARTSFSAPDFKVTCYATAFYNQTSKLFLYDEDMFSMAQCDCSPGFFGRPQDDLCLRCPSRFATCTGPFISVWPNHYAYDLFNGMNDVTSQAKTEAELIAADPLLSSLSKISELWALPAADPSAATFSQATDSSSSNARVYRYLETETCLISTSQVLSRQSNCLGYNETAPSANFGAGFKRQCAEGSSGRLCSKCSCESKQDCWFWRDPVCVKCSFTISLPISIALAIALFLGIIVSFSIISAIILGFKRKQDIRSYSRLPLHKRTIARFLHFTSLGNVSILITFLQLLLAITEWDAYAKAKWLSLLNGSVVGLGLTCIFPFFAAPNFEQTLAVNLPYLGLVVTLAGVWIGGKIADRWSRTTTKTEAKKPIETPPGEMASDGDESSALDSSAQEDESSALEESSLLDGSVDEEATAAPTTNINGDASSDDDDDSFADASVDTPLVKTTPRRDPLVLDIFYPTGALMTSLTYTVFKFLYFGTALAAHQYLFPVTQYASGHKYSMYKPYLSYAASKPLILLSGPMIVYADLIVPIMFTIHCFLHRKQLGTWRLKIYYGTLFDNYSEKCFWWEIINFFKKLSVALILRGIPSNNAIQSALILSILAGIMVIQQKLNPWRRKSENLLDGLSSLVLIGALLATRPSNLTFTAAVSWYAFALSIAFAIGCVVFIIYETLTEIPESEQRAKQVFSTAMQFLEDHDPEPCIAVGLLPNGRK